MLWFVKELFVYTVSLTVVFFHTGKERDVHNKQIFVHRLRCIS